MADAGMRILLTGYFDRGNLGDDAMRDGLLHHLSARHPAVGITQTPLPSFSISGLRSLVSFVGALRKADVLVLNGGTYFHDGLGWRSYRILVSFVAIFALARLCGVPIACAGIGVGPLRRPVPRALVRLTLSLCAATLVRDPESARTVSRLGARTTLLKGFDLAALLPEQLHSQTSASGVIGVSIVPYFTNYHQRPDMDEQVVETLVAAFGVLLQHDPQLTVRVYAFHRGTGESDLALSIRLAERLGSVVPTTLVECRSPMQVLNDFASLDALLATRYHALILGYLARIPVAAVQYDQKCVSLARQIGLPDDLRLTPRDLLSRARVVQVLSTLARRDMVHTASLPISEARDQAGRGLDALMERLSAISRDDRNT